MMLAKKIVELRDRIVGLAPLKTYIPCDALYESSAARCAYILFLVDLIFMIRGYAVANLAEGLLFFCFLISGALRTEFLKALKDSTIMPLILFYVWILLSCFWSLADWSAIFENWVDWRKILLVPIGIVLLNNMQKAKIALSVLVALGLIYLCVAMVDLILAVQLWDRPYYRVAQDANIQGLYFVIVGSYFFLLCSTYDQSRFVMIILAAIGSLFFLMVVVFGISRSGYISFLIAASILAVYFSRGRIVIIGFIIICVTAVLGTSPNFGGRVEQALAELAVGAFSSEGSHTSGSIRAVMWFNTVEMILERPVLGTGAGGFEIGYGQIVDGVLGWRGVITDDPHSHYFHVWAEYGLIGMILFLLYQCRLFAAVKWQTPIGYLLGITILSCSVLAIFQGAFGSFAMGRLSFMFFTILFVISHFERRERLSEL